MRDIKPREEKYLCCEGPSMGKKDEVKKFYPHLRLEHDFFPETKKWEVGKEYEVTLKLKMTGISISRFQNDSDFDIIGVEFDEEKEENEDEK